MDVGVRWWKCIGSTFIGKTWCICKPWLKSESGSMTFIVAFAVSWLGPVEGKICMAPQRHTNTLIMYTFHTCLGWSDLARTNHSQQQLLRPIHENAWPGRPTTLPDTGRTWKWSYCNCLQANHVHAKSNNISETIKSRDWNDSRCEERPFFNIYTFHSTSRNSFARCTRASDGSQYAVGAPIWDCRVPTAREGYGGMQGGPPKLHGRVTSTMTSRHLKPVLLTLNYLQDWCKTICLKGPFVFCCTSTFAGGYICFMPKAGAWTL